MNKYIESEKIELKEKYRETIVKEIVSFLNGDGGTIFLLE
ncbi:ATP-binding protein [Treponema vincentii]|nr:ATP-binding protein [Treponema vincentii]